MFWCESFSSVQAESRVLNSPSSLALALTTKVQSSREAPETISAPRWSAAAKIQPTGLGTGRFDLRPGAG